MQTDTVKQVHEGTDLTLTLFDSGYLRIALTDVGRAELPELIEQYKDKPYADEMILAELLRAGAGDGFLGNGYEFAFTLDDWGHMTDAPGISNEFFIDDDGNPPSDPYNLWYFNEYALYPTITERLQGRGYVDFTWWDWHGEKPVETAYLG